MVPSRSLAPESLRSYSTSTGDWSRERSWGPAWASCISCGAAERRAEPALPEPDGRPVTGGRRGRASFRLWVSGAVLTAGSPLLHPLSNNIRGLPSFTAGRTELPQASPLTERRQTEPGLLPGVSTGLALMRNAPRDNKGTGAANPLEKECEYLSDVFAHCLWHEYPACLSPGPQSTAHVSIYPAQGQAAPERLPGICSAANPLPSWVSGSWPFCFCMALPPK